MVQIAGEIVIRRPVEIVFDTLGDPRQERTYNDRVLAAEMLTPGPIAEGSRFEQQVRRVGRTDRATVDITGFQRPSRLALMINTAAMVTSGDLQLEEVLRMGHGGVVGEQADRSSRWRHHGRAGRRLRRGHPQMVRGANRDLCATIEAEDAFDLTDRLSRIKVPTLVVGGDRDAAYGPALFRETAEGVPNGKLLLYSCTGHVGMQARRRFVPDVLRFLS